MKRTMRFRFKLSSLLALVTLAAAGFGYLRYTRGVLRATCVELEADGVDVSFEEIGPQWLRQTIDSDLWLRKAVKAELTIVQIGPAVFNVAGQNLGPGETDRAVGRIAERLQRIGVQEMSLEILPAPLYWHEPGETPEKDRERQIAGDEQKQKVETFAAAYGFADRKTVIAMGGRRMVPVPTPTSARAPAGK
jgi:hypothetical protein